MKKSELKEAIKAEIKSVLSEAMSPEEVKGKMDQAIRGGAKAEPLAKLATIGLEGETVRIKGNQQEYKVEKVMANGDVLISRDGKNVGTFTPNQLELAEGDIREEDEPTAADLKKKDSVATISNKLQKLTAKMKDKAKEYKAAEGEAKEKIKDELKAMTAEKKKLEKSL